MQIYDLKLLNGTFIKLLFVVKYYMKSKYNAIDFKIIQIIFVKKKIINY